MLGGRDEPDMGDWLAAGRLLAVSVSIEAPEDFFIVVELIALRRRYCGSPSPVCPTGDGMVGWVVEKFGKTSAM
eukprot:scaffold12253_cov79-Skeletonema_marinoi.AAC.2